MGINFLGIPPPKGHTLLQIRQLPIELRYDTNLATCDLARRAGDDGTLACAECGRAFWMHFTRHETCRLFTVVRPKHVTDAVVTELRSIPGLHSDARFICSIAMNDFGTWSYIDTKEARYACMRIINGAFQLSPEWSAWRTSQL